MPRPHLIVVPLSTLPNWEREFAAWAPHLNVVMLYGNQAARDVVWRHEVYAPAAMGERVTANRQVSSLQGSARRPSHRLPHLRPCPVRMLKRRSAHTRQRWGAADWHGG